MFIATKLKINALIVLVGLFTIAILSYSSIGELKNNYHHTEYISEQTSSYKSVMVGGLLVNSALGVYSFSYDTPKSQQKALGTIKIGLKKVLSFQKKIKNSNDTVFVAFESAVQGVLQDIERGKKIDKKDLKKVLKVWRPLKFDVTQKIKELRETKAKLIKEFNSEIDTLFSTILTVIIINTLLIMFISFFISRGIISSLGTLEKAMKDLSQGKGSEEIRLKNKDESYNIAHYFNIYMHSLEDSMHADREVIGEVKEVIERVNAGFFNVTVKGHAQTAEVEEVVQEVNKMIMTMEKNLTIITDTLIAFGNSQFDHKIPKVEHLSGLIGSMLMGIRGVGNTVSEVLALMDNANKRLIYGSKDLTSSSINLSDASNSQATALEQTVTSIKEVTETIKQSSQNTNQMSMYAKEVTNSVQKGKELANETSESMDHIQSEVNSISDSITVIDQIAFQTNILSLNAAVEAATAGEAGKGFAVVAGEVRNLASRSAEAANEIKALVESAKDKALEGKDISSHMIDGYGVLNENIQKTISLIDKVTSSSKEQSDAMIQINDAISLLDKSIQNNATEAQQISDMAKVNEELATNLQVAIDRTSFDKNSKKRVCDVNMIFDVAKLKLNHITFKNDVIAQSKEGYKFQVKSDHECALGKWIDQHEGTQIAQSKAWQELKEAHKLVHSQTQRVADVHAVHGTNQELFGVSDSVESSMSQVFDKLNQIRQDNCDFEFQKNKDKS
jgi:methyl-accepting chemotaxis protein